MTVLRSTLALGFLLPPTTHRRSRRQELRGNYAPKPGQIVFAYGLAALALGFLLLALGLPGTHVPKAADGLNAASLVHQRMELHGSTAPLPMPVP